MLAKWPVLCVTSVRSKARRGGDEQVHVVHADAHTTKSDAEPAKRLGTVRVERDHIHVVPEQLLDRREGRSWIGTAERPDIQLCQRNARGVKAAAVLDETVGQTGGRRKCAERTLVSSKKLTRGSPASTVDACPARSPRVAGRPPRSSMAPSC